MQVAMLRPNRRAMPKSFEPGDCAKIPDGRIARVREKIGSKYKVRVRRKSSDTHQFLTVAAAELKHIECPKGWMSPDGYNRYLKVTLAKQRQRLAAKSHGHR
jgi:hypothetical protein